MNIFILDSNITRCAQYHANQHVGKMILESAQMLCAVCNEHGIKTPYKTTHNKHPCTIWAGKSLANWRWLRDLALELNKEFKYRYERVTDHKSAVIVRNLNEPPIADVGLTSFAQAMPEQYRRLNDPIQAYRNFYIAEKSSFATWKRRAKPKWYKIGAGREVAVAKK